MSDQAARLRELVREAPPLRRGRIVAVTSGKGGTGKTNLAVNLSVALAERGLQVVLVDLDLGLANADILFNAEARWNLAHVVRGEKTFPEILLPVAPRLRLLPGSSGFPRLADLSDADREALLENLDALESSADYLVIDTGAGISANVVQFVCAADEAIVVTTPEPTSVMDAFAMIKMISQRRLPERLRVVVNQARDRSQALTTAEKIVAISRRFLKVPVEKMGYVASDYHLPEAVLRRRPVLWDAPTAPASACFRTLAGILDERARTALPGRPGMGFFRRASQFWTRRRQSV